MPPEPDQETARAQESLAFAEYVIVLGLWTNDEGEAGAIFTKIHGLLDGTDVEGAGLLRREQRLGGTYLAVAATPKPHPPRNRGEGPRP